MKKIVLMATVIFSFITLNAQNEVKSKLEKVTVYPNSALVEKSAKVSLIKGENKFIITDNATTFSKDNLHFYQQEDFFITSVNVKDISQSFNQAASETFSQNVLSQINTLKDKLEKTNKKINDNNTLINTYNQQLMALNNMKAIKNTQAIDTVKTIKSQFDFQREEILKLNNLILTTRKENEELQFVRNQQEDELENLVRQHNGNCKLTTKSKNIVVSIYSNRNMTTTLHYDYLVYSVASTYNYNVMLDENINRAIFNLKTNVSQNTNENWKDCDIVFSTNEAGYAGEDAELYTWYLNATPQYQPRATMEAKRAMLSNNTLAVVEEKEVSADYGAMEDVALAGGSAVENLTLSREYTLTTKQSISSNDKPQTIPLTFDTTKVLFKHFATPKAIEKVYYTALLPDWEDLALQNVACDIFLNGKYIAKSFVNTNSTKDTMKFSAGEDNNVKISRKVRKSSPDKSFLSSNVEETVTVTLHVKNTKNSVIDLEIKDQVPISQNADIKITNVDRGDGNLNANTGIIKWNLHLQPKETKELKFSYTVKYPKDFNLYLN